MGSNRKNDKYYYTQEEDFNSVSVSFYPDQTHPLQVSERGTKLNEMMGIPGVRSLFEENEWATSFVPNDYIMTPTLWNNIYKGAIGEVVGKYLFETVSKVKVTEITNPDDYELFDYAVDGTSVYLDFKNWHEGFTANREETLQKIAEKAQKCGASCVIVANVIAAGEWNVRETDILDVHIVEIPCLVREVDGKVGYDRNAWDVIQRCLYVYKD